jgi:hypothetical protein
MALRRSVVEPEHPELFMLVCCKAWDMQQVYTYLQCVLDVVTPFCCSRGWCFCRNFYACTSSRAIKHKCFITVNEKHCGTSGAAFELVAVQLRSRVRAVSATEARGKRLALFGLVHCLKGPNTRAATAKQSFAARNDLVMEVIQ